MKEILILFLLVNTVLFITALYFFYAANKILNEIKVNINNPKKVSIEHINRLIKEIERINAINFDEIIYTKNNKPLTFTKEQIDSFKETDLTNIDFIQRNFYKTI